jgi:phosphonopyruvate decarboxylase
LTREAAIAAVVAALPDDCPVVATTGMASRELFELRRASGQGHHRDFLTVGGMGHAGQIAAGLAMAKPDRPVACIDGDGAVLMHMGGLTISADCPNLLHILINNGAHDSVGGQPTKGAVVSFAEIAKACGYQRIALACDTAGIAQQVPALLGRGSSAFLEIKCRPGARANVGRPDRSPGENKRDFMTFLQGGL